MKILFVCTGNTCRSNMAEAIFNSLNKCEDVTASSAGLFVVPKSKTSKNTSFVLKNNMNLDISNREAIQITEDILNESDLILTMTVGHKNSILSSFPCFSNKVYTLKELVGEEGDIVDPFGGDVRVYDMAFNEIKTNIELLIKKIKKED